MDLIQSKAFSNGSIKVIKGKLFTGQISDINNHNELKMKKSLIAYWNEMPTIDRVSWLRDLYIEEELATYAYSDLPSHIRMVLTNKWNKTKDNSYYGKYNISEGMERNEKHNA